MELRHKVEKNLGNEVEKARWHSKFLDSVKDIAVSIKNNLTKLACTIAVPAIVVAGAAGCYSSYQRTGDLPPMDSSTDTAVDTGYDSGTDPIEEDVHEEDVIEEDVPDVEVPSPCDDLTESTTVNNLIGDYLNRRLNDRNDNVSGSSDAEYPIGGSDISENANPFSDGEDGILISAPLETFMHRVSGDSFVPLADSTVSDDSAAKEYSEEQNIWVRGSSYYSDVLDDVTGDVRFVVYNAKFSGESDDFGIPVCTDGIDGDYTYCKSDAEDADYDYATELHKVRVMFLGSEWVITELSAPIGPEVSNERKVQNGGYVKLAKEAVSGIVNQDESLLFAGLRFQLDDLEVHAGVTSAIISVLNSDGDVLKRDMVHPGTTKEFNIEGTIYKLHVYGVAPGYTLGAKWADMAILSDEIKIEDGHHLDPDYDRFRDWEGVVGWKNKGASSTDAQVDHLRMFAIYADDIADISSSGESTLLPGEGFSFPYELGVCYSGLDTTNENLHRIKFQLETVSTYNISSTSGPIDPATGERVACELYPPYVKISTAGDMDFMATGETLVDNEFYVATDGASCGGSIGYLEAGALFMRLSPTSHNYDYQEYSAPVNGVVFDVFDYPEAATMGGIMWSAWEYGLDGVVDYGRPVNIDTDSAFVFHIYENARYGTDYAYFAVAEDSFNPEIYYTDSGETVFRSNDLVYKYAGPVNAEGSITFAGEGFITERGSVFSSISDTQVEYYVSDQVAYSVFYVGIED